MKLYDIPKVSLGVYPTPLEPLRNLSEKLGKGNLFIKRDDSAGPAFGGNKTRKLEYIIHEALEQKCTVMLTVGGPQTNHGRTTVAAAVKHGLKPVLVLSGEQPAALSGNLVLDAMMGADIIFAGNDLPSAVNATIARYEAAGEKVYNLPVGGSTHLGALGYIMAVGELTEQLAKTGVSPTYLVCPVGSLGTYCGLNIGAKYFNAPFRVLGIPVSPQAAERHEAAAKFIRECSEAFGLDISFEPDELLICNGPDDAPYSGEAYNKPDLLTRAAMYELAKTEGIILDPVYTGKAFRGMLDLLESGFIKPDEDVIFLHTGGAMAVWTKEHLDDMQPDLAENCTMDKWTP